MRCKSLLVCVLIIGCAGTLANDYVRIYLEAEPKDLYVKTLAANVLGSLGGFVVVYHYYEWSGSASSSHVVNELLIFTDNKYIGRFRLKDNIANYCISNNALNIVYDTESENQYDKYLFIGSDIYKHRDFIPLQKTTHPDSWYKESDK